MSVLDLWNKAHGICDMCDGMGDLATTDRAAVHPEKYPDELQACPDCDGKHHPKALTPDKGLSLLGGDDRIIEELVKGLQG